MHILVVDDEELALAELTHEGIQHTLKSCFSDSGM